MSGEGYPEGEFSDADSQSKYPEETLKAGADLYDWAHTQLKRHGALDVPTLRAHLESGGLSFTEINNVLEVASLTNERGLDTLKDGDPYPTDTGHIWAHGLFTELIWATQDDLRQDFRP